jgi:Superinfection immunity protein
MTQPYPPAPAYRFESSTTVKVVAWIVAVLSSLYMLPWAIAATRNLRNHWTIFWIDLLLGWTIVGWVIGLVMACRSKKPDEA